MIAPQRDHVHAVINKPATLPGDQRTRAGAFFVENPSMRFTKAPLSISDQLSKMEARGLNISDRAKAEHYLQFIGYYRISAYALFFQEARFPNKPFRPDITFEDTLNLYKFDRELRLLTIDAIERIEVAVRSCMVNEMCTRHGSHWFMDSTLFYPRYNHANLLNRIAQELGIRPGASSPARPHNEMFVNHYYAKYGDPWLPPAWMIAETLSLGSWSLMFDNLRLSNERKAVASHFGINDAVLSNWLHVLTHVRNICAHHGRLWNRKLVIKFQIAKIHRSFLITNDSYYSVAVVIEDLLRRVAPSTGWHLRLRDLLAAYPIADQTSMGFPAGWDGQPFWNLVLPSQSTSH